MKIENAKKELIALRSVSLHYVGASEYSNNRIVNIYYNEDLEESENLMDFMIERMENTTEYKVAFGEEGVYTVEVLDMDDYKTFSKEWQKIKKEVRKELKEFC